MAKTKKKKARFAGSSLVPDIEGRRASLGIITEVVYWVGLIPSCPTDAITLAGVCFPKMNERLIADPMRPGSGKKARVPVNGAIVRLTAAHIERMRDRLRRTVIRFYEAAQKDEPNTGINVGDDHYRARRGQVITIPTAEDIKKRIEKGRPTREYVPAEFDLPAADFMYAVPCPDQANPERSQKLPDVLSETGLDWPGDEDEIADLIGD